MAIFNRNKYCKEITEELLKHKADPNIKNNEGYCPIHIAIKKG